MDALSPLNEARKLLQEASKRFLTVKTDQEWLSYAEKCTNREWVYLVVWSSNPLVFCWGHSSGEGKRLRFSGLLNNIQMGKYDYRVDYLMMKAIFGQPSIEIYEFDRSSEMRSSLLLRRLKVALPWWGITGQEAGDITRTVFNGFKKSKAWEQLGPEKQALLTEYMHEVYWAKLNHPRNPSRQFWWSDSLDADFLELIDKAHLLPALEDAFGLKFPKKSFKISRTETLAPLDASNADQDAADHLDRTIRQITKAEPEQLLAQIIKRNSGT